MIRVICWISKYSRAWKCHFFVWWGLCIC